jgi:hypothetical protein
VLGNSGAWESGDWIVHWPGTHKPTRIARAEAHTQLLIK